MEISQDASHKNTMLTHYFNFQKGDCRPPHPVLLKKALQGPPAGVAFALPATKSTRSTGHRESYASRESG
jgi:hypothetical protein